LHAVVESSVNHVGLNHQVLIDEVSRVGVVGVNAAHLGCGHVDLVGLFLGEEGLHGSLVGQVELGVGASDDAVRGLASGQQLANDGGADHAAMAGDVDAGLGVCHLHASIGCTATRP
jgi:hypothetical protein